MARRKRYGAKKHSVYRPTNEVVERREEIYGHIDTMIERRNDTYAEFADDGGQQTLKQYIDDSDRRLNGSVLTREAQGKEDWQANVFNQVTRAKARAVVAGVATTFPEFTWKAWKGGVQSPQRAEFMKQMVAYSRQHENQRLKMFWEAWECAGKGTVITYDGFRRVKEEVDVITSYDPLTGVAYTEKEEVMTEEHAVDEIIPLTELYIWDIYIHNIQEQPRVARIDYLDKDAVRKEYGHYENYKYLKDGATCASSRYGGENDTYYYAKWGKRVSEEDNKYERIRYYSKADNCYEIWVNGVLMQKTPLIWGGKRGKLYPFAKTIYEPFSNKAFFYGLSLPKLLQSFQDVDNMHWDSILDNAFRSLSPRLLAGLANKDLLDIEDELSTQDDVQYVPDVTQVRPMPVRGVQGGDVQLLNMIRQAMDFVSVDPAQQGQTGVSGKTAREVMIANERAQELKGIFYMMLEDLWLQKTKLRIPNVLMNYMRPAYDSVLGEQGSQVMMGAIAQYDIADVMLADGSQGTLGVGVYKSKNQLPHPADLEGKEDAMREQGMNYKQIAITSNYADEYQYDFRLIPTSLENQSLSAQVAKVSEKQANMAQLYPEYFAANKDKMFSEFIEPYGETLEDYQQPEPEPDPMQQGESLLDFGGAEQPPQPQQ